MGITQDVSSDGSFTTLDTVMRINTRNGINKGNYYKSTSEICCLGNSV